MKPITATPVRQAQSSALSAHNKTQAPSVIKQAVKTPLPSATATATATATSASAAIVAKNTNGNKAAVNATPSKNQPKPVTQSVAASSTTMKAPSKPNTTTSAAPVSRMSLAELRKHVEMISLEQERIIKERDALQARVSELEHQALRQSEAMSLVEEKAALSEQHAEQSSEKLRSTSARLEAAERRLEALGDDPIALTPIVSEKDAEDRVAKEEVARFGAELHALHSKLHVSHDAIQSNIARMTGILAALNGNASEFADVTTSSSLAVEDEDDKLEDALDESFDASKYSIDFGDVAD